MTPPSKTTGKKQSCISFVWLYLCVIFLSCSFICRWPVTGEDCPNFKSQSYWTSYWLCDALLQDLELATVWDDHLCYLLSSALSAYELERCTGVSCGNEEFQDAVRRAVPDGHTFKGFPIHFLHRNARRAFATCLRWGGYKLWWTCGHKNVPSINFLW